MGNGGPPDCQPEGFNQAKDMLNKSVTSINLNSAKSHNELGRFLTNITEKFLGSVSDYPLVVKLLQEATKKADLKFYAE